MDGATFIVFFFYGGFVAALVLLALATFMRSSKRLRLLRVIGAFCGLIYQGGCFAAASGFGKATGNGGTDETAGGILVIAFLITLIWSILIFIYWSEKDVVNCSENTKNPPESGQ